MGNGYVKDHICCRSTVLRGLAKKFARPIRLLSVGSDNGGQLKNFVFSVGKKDEDGDTDVLRITTTEDGLMLKLLELLSNGNVCKYCESKGTDYCIQTRLKSGDVKKEEFVHIMDEELCFA